MNLNKIIIRVISNTNRFYGQGNLCRSIQQLPICSMSTHASTSQVTTAKEKEVFQEMLPSLIDSIAADPRIAQVPEAASWMKQVLEYNLIGGKKSRGLATVFAYEMLAKPESITEESLKLARSVGWSVEMAYFLVMDDVMDGATTRRGAACWYRRAGVGLGAVNDTIFIRHALVETLKKNVNNKNKLYRFLDIFDETLIYTSMGQHLDYTMTHRDKDDYSLFTIDRYFSIVKYKTAFYTYKLPLTLGLLLADIEDENTHAVVEDICMDLGKLFQTQDDYLDCFGDEARIGKIGTDIQEGKCTWLAATALTLLSGAQRLSFTRHYASKDPHHVDVIKQLYRELRLPELYKEEENLVYNVILLKLNALPPNIKKLMLKLLDITYKRDQ